MISSQLNGRTIGNFLSIFKILIPHFMKVGGSLYFLQNGMDDSSIYVVMNFLEKGAGGFNFRTYG